MQSANEFKRMVTSADWENALAFIYQRMQQKIDLLTEDNIRDSATGAYNRRYWDTCVSEANHSTSSFAVVMVDVDGLKTVNDTLGHHAGDELINSTIQLLIETFRTDTDTVCRIGGDEISVLIPLNMDLVREKFFELPPEVRSKYVDENEYIVNQIHHRISEQLSLINQNRSNSPQIEVSYGIKLSHPESGQQPHDLNHTLELADQQMYQMKHLHHANKSA